MPDCGTALPWQDKDASIRLLEAQVASLQAVGGQLEQQLRHEQAGGAARHLGLVQSRQQALASAQQAVAAADLAVNHQLQEVQAVVQELGTLLSNQPGQWLLSAADLSKYYESAAVCQTQATR